MNILWTNAFLWPLLAAVAVPLLLHLFARLRPRVYRFPSAEFIHRVVRRTTRMKRPHDYWLLLLRTLLFAAILILFLKPVLHLRHRGETTRSARHVIAIVDATASMGWVEGARTRFAAACAEAAEALGGLTDRDQANVIWLRAQPVGIFPELGRNIPYLRQELRRAGVTYEAGDIPAALQLAVRMLDGTEGQREIHILSDFQQVSWEQVPLPEVPGVEWIKIPVAREMADNTAIRRVVTDPPQPLAGEPFSLMAEIRHYGPTPRRLNVYLTLGEIHRSREVLLPAWGAGNVVFQEHLDAVGEHPFEIRLDDDAFVADDRHVGIVPVRDGLRIGLYSADDSVAAAWERVMQAVGWARVLPLREADLHQHLDAEVLLLAGWDGRGVGVRELLRRGGAVIAYPARDRPFHWPEGMMAEAPADGEAVALRWEENHRRPWGLQVVAEDDPLFRIFEGGAFGDPARARFAARFRVPPPESDGGHDANVLMRYRDGVPALMRRRSSGTFYLWNLSLDPQHTAWTRHEEFVALFAELVLSGRAVTTRTSDILPGDRLSWMPEQDFPAADVRLVTPQGALLAVAALPRAGGRIVTAGIAERPGRYTWRAHERILAYTCVNFPAVESDLRTLTPADLRSGGDALTLSGGHTVRRLREGIPLWPYALAAALLLATTEGWAAWQFGRKKTNPPPA